MDVITPSVNKAKWLCAIVLLLAPFFQENCTAQSVPIYASSIVSDSNVDLPANSIDGNPATRARIRASSGIAIGIGAYSGNLEIEFPNTLPANTTSFVKIQTDDNLLPALLSGSLGNLLSNVLGTVLIGNQEFTVEAKNGNSVVLLGRSQFINDFSTSRLRVVANANNEYFIALTPSQPYKSIKLTNRVGSLVGLGNTKRLDVYEAFYIGTPDVCGGASYTSFDGSGLNLDLLNLGGAGVTNPNFVLDSNPNNFSRLSLGILGVAASIEQTVYFDGTSQPTDQFFIRLKVDPSLLAVGVANNIQIVAANGPNVIQTVNLNSLLNLDLLTLLQGNQAVTIPFSPNATVNRITVRYNSLLNVQLTQSLDLYGITRAPGQPTITDAFTLNPTICSGSTASLVALTGTGTQLVWYSQPTGGSPLITVNSGQPFVTPALTQSTSYYVAAKKIGCPEESLRVKVDVTVISVPTAADITIPSPMTACNGSVVLSPVSSIGGATFRYYKDQLKTQEITTGYAGDAGVTYAINPATGVMTITGLTALNSPYNYFISLTVGGLCENAVNTLKQVVVNYSSTLVLNISPAIQGCGSVNLRDAIFNFDNSSDIVYTFFNSSHTPITAVAAANITTGGIFYIQSSSLSGSCSSLEQQVTVTVNPLPTLNITATNVVVNLGSSVTLQAASNAAITWYDPNGNALPSNTFGPFTTAGFYTFTAIANNGTCTRSGNVFVTVIDPANCPALTERVYADTQNWGSIITGGVFNAADAADGNPRTHSTITTGLGLLGIGTTWQTLQWNQTIAAGTPVTIKLGSEYSAVVLAGAYSVIGTKRNSSGVPVDIGALRPVSGSLLDVIAGDNTFEYTFVPSNNSGPKDYDGVRIVVGSLVSLAQSVKVYEAYYDRQVAQLACAPGDVEDVFYGSVDLGIGVTTATVGVADPYDAVDASAASYATMFSGLGVLAAADLTVSFRTPTLTGDSLEIILSRPSTILNLGLLTGFTVQMYMGNSPVGLPLDNTSSLLQLTLLGGGAQARLTVHQQTQPYDRIKIRFGGVASVLDILRVHDVQRVADTSIDGADPTNNTIEACPEDILRLNITPEDCATFIWYDAAVGGNIVSTGTSFTVPSTLAAGTYNFYIQPVRFGCEVYRRGIVTVIVGQTAPPTAITQILINGGTDPIVCTATGDVNLQAVLNTTMTITNPVFHWYSFDGTTQLPIAGQTTSTLALAGLAPGTYTYYVGVSSDEYCETSEGDRATVTITIRPFSQPSDINVTDAAICQTSGIATLNPTSTQPNPQFFWFVTNDNTQPIANGAVIGGITFAISTDGELTASGLTSTNSPYTYYVGLTSDATCLNQNGNFKPVTITVDDEPTPTTTENIQDFCVINNPTVANIQVNETGVIWYDAPTAGNVVPSTTALVDNTIYYGVLVDAVTGCESSVRLALTVNVNDTLPPSTTNNTQDFCVINNPTVANIQVNETGVIWYDAPTAGNVVPSTTALVDNTIYYGVLVDAVTGCESSVRLAVTVNVNDTLPPTTTSATQDFCVISNPTVANIQVNETGVIWYDAPTAGNIVPSTAALVDNAIYYGALVDATTTCESSIRLAVTVNIEDASTPTTTSTSQSFCLVDNPTVANIQVNETGIIWYDAPTGGNLVATITALANGAVYYASLSGGLGCESSIRLAITITVNSGTTPTTTSNTQSFCSVDIPTLASIQVNEPNVTWYDAPTNGNILASTMPITNGGIYYASIIDGTGCASSIRLAVTTNTSNGTTPTATNPTQSFCQTANPTLADVQVNEAGVTWYDAPTGGSILPSTTALVDGGVYYASIVDASGCASLVRLEVTTTFQGNTPALLVGGTDPTCAFDQVTYTTNPGMTNYSWSVNNGIVVAGGQPTDDFITISWTAVGPALVTVNFTNNCGGNSARELAINVVSCSDLTITKTVDNPAPAIDSNVVFTVTVNNVGPNQIMDVTVNEPLPSGYSFVSASATTGTFSNGIWNIPMINANESVTMWVTARVLSTGDYTNTVSIGGSNPTDTDSANNTASVTTVPLCLVVYNEFSPNDDGANEFFIIDCIENYPNNKLHVYNRYGALVYDQKGYNNDWNGIANVSGVIKVNDKLPTGTYYYVLDLGEDKIVKTGWLSIAR